MIKPSPELVAIVRRWSDAIRRKDGRTLTNLFSASRHLRYIGTAKGELWEGAVLRDGFAEHVQEIPDYVQEETMVEAFECGTVGWAVWQGVLSFPEMDQPAQLRTTFVFALEDGSWKIVQHHGSNPSSNIEIIGVEHTALDDLVAAAKDGFHQDQHEGMASVMFTDIANSSAIADLLGDRVWAATIQAHFDSVARVIAANGGRLVKSLGDGTMSTYSSARSAMKAAIEIQRCNRDAASEPQLRLRIGVHTGDVIQTEDDFFGTVVNKAARLAAVASPDEICVSDATAIMVGASKGFAFSEASPVILKGLEGEHSLHRLAW